MNRFFCLFFIFCFAVNIYALKGDINQDGIVDGYDLIILARSFGSSLGEKNYNLSADITNSSKVDGEDLALLASNFGRRTSGIRMLYLIKDSTEASYKDPLKGKSKNYKDAYSTERYKYVELAEEVRSGTGIQPGDIIYLNLFRDIEYTAYIDRITQNIKGTTAVRGRIDNYDYSYFIISTTDGISLGTIVLPERNEYYKISNIPYTDMHLLTETESLNNDFIDRANPVRPPAEMDFELIQQDAIRSFIEMNDLGPEDHADLDIMIVYTPSAANFAQTQGGMNNIISQAMERAQVTIDNSLILASANLVFAGQVDYAESGDSYIDLYRLTASPDFNPFGEYIDGYYIPGYMDEVHLWRDQYGADLVALFAYVNDVGGLGWLLANPNGRPEYAFSLTRVQQAIGYTHIHETGHNMGAHHHKEQTESPGPGLFPYSAGWRWIGTNNIRYCSVMTYSSGRYFPDGQNHTTVAHFSNPDVVHFGVPTGHAQDGDNARTLREVKHVVAAYRQSEGNPPLAPSDLDYSLESVDEVILTWLDNSTNEAGFEIEWRQEEGDIFIVIGATGPNISSFTHSGLEANTTHYYRVRAFNEYGYSEYTDTITLTIGMGW